MTPIFQWNLAARAVYEDTLPYEPQPVDGSGRTYPGDNRHSVAYTGPQAFQSLMNVKSYRVTATYVDTLWPDASGVFTNITRRRWNQQDGHVLDVRHITDGMGFFDGVAINPEFGLQFGINWRGMFTNYKADPFLYQPDLVFNLYTLSPAITTLQLTDPLTGTPWPPWLAPRPVTIDWQGATAPADLPLYGNVPMAVFQGSLAIEVKESQRYDTLVLDPPDAPAGTVMKVYSVLPKDSPLEHFTFQDAIDPMSGVALGNVPALWMVVSAIIDDEARQVLLVTVPLSAVRGQPVQIWTSGGYPTGDSYCTRGRWWGPS